jgi:hypothetical protein
MDAQDKKARKGALDKLKRFFVPSVEIEVETETSEDSEEKRKKREKDKAELKKLMGL